VILPALLIAITMIGHMHSAPRANPIHALHYE